LPREDTTPPVMKMYRAMGLNLYPRADDSPRTSWARRHAFPE
jgi:hypothetical protein